MSTTAPGPSVVAGAVEEEEEGLLYEIRMDGTPDHQSRRRGASSAAGQPPPSTVQHMQRDGVLRAMQGLRVLLVLWLVGEHWCGQGAAWGRRLKAHSRLLCVLLGFETGVLYGGGQGSSSPHFNWKGFVSSRALALAPLYWVALVLLLPKYLARSADPDYHLPGHAHRRSGSGALLWRLRDWDVLLTGTQAWGGQGATLALLPDLSYASIEWGLLLAYPLLRPLTTAFRHAMRLLLRRRQQHGSRRPAAGQQEPSLLVRVVELAWLVGPVAALQGLCMLLAALLGSHHHHHRQQQLHSAMAKGLVAGPAAPAQAAGGADSDEGVLVLAVALPYFLSGLLAADLLAVLPHQHHHRRAASSSGLLSAGRLGWASDVLALAMVAMVYLPLSARPGLDGWTLWCGLPLLLSALLPCVWLSGGASFVRHHVLEARPLAAWLGPLAWPAYLTHTAVGDVWLFWLATHGSLLPPLGGGAGGSQGGGSSSSSLEAIKALAESSWLRTQGRGMKAVALVLVLVLSWALQRYCQGPVEAKAARLLPSLKEQWARLVTTPPSPLHEAAEAMGKRAARHFNYEDEETDDEGGLVMLGALSSSEDEEDERKEQQQLKQELEEEVVAV